MYGPKMLVRLLTFRTVIAAVVAVALAAPPAWGQLQKLVAEDGEELDYFGYSVAIDDDVALIGATDEDERAPHAGAAYVFRRTDGVWTQEAKLFAADAEEGDRFGRSVALRGDLALVGAIFEDDRGEGAGAVYVFRHTDGAWVQEAKLLAADGGRMDFFGCSVALGNDVALIGAYSRNENSITNVGAAYVFRHTDGVWTQGAKLLAADGQEDDYFGISVAISDDVALIGANGEDERGDRAGAAYIFRRTDGSWTQEQKLLALDGEAGDRFGGNVAISGDVTLISADWDDDRGDSAGAAYVFRYTDGVWAQEAKLLAADGEAGDYLGSSVACNDDVVLVGADGEDAGAMYVFRHTDGAWVQEAKLLAVDGEEGDRFGCSIALSNDLVLIGAYWEDERGTNAGAAYVGSIAMCPADLDGSGVVDFGDILAILTAWGNPGGPEDLDSSGAVDFGDILVVLTAWGQPCEYPLSDGCERAPVGGEGARSFSNENATTDGPDLPPECDEGNGLLFRNDVWFKYRASCDGTAMASVCESTFDTRLAVYEYSEDECPGTFLACSDDACGENGTRSEVSFSVESGGTYLIRIGARFAVGEGTLVIDCLE